MLNEETYLDVAVGFLYISSPATGIKMTTEYLTMKYKIFEI